MKIFFVTVSNIFSRTYSNAATFYNDSGFFFSLSHIHFHLNRFKLVSLRDLSSMKLNNEKRREKSKKRDGR